MITSSTDLLNTKCKAKSTNDVRSRSSDYVSIKTDDVNLKPSLLSTSNLTLKTSHPSRRKKLWALFRNQSRKLRGKKEDVIQTASEVSQF